MDLNAKRKTVFSCLIDIKNLRKQLCISLQVHLTVYIYKDMYILVLFSQR